MSLSPEDVRNKQFTTVRLREGYDEDEVDAFLDEVEAELTRLLRENEDLRAKLAAATRAAAQNQANMRKEQQPQDARQGAPVPAAISGPPVPGQGGMQQGPGVPGQQQMQQQMGNQPLGLPSGAPQLPSGQGGPMGQPNQQQMQQMQQQQMNQTMGGQQQLVQPMGGQMLQPMGQQQMGQPQQMGQTMGGQQQLQPMGGPMGQQLGGPMGAPMQQQQSPGGDSAARVLALAQQTADQAISEARSEANKIVGEARSRAEGLERDARAKADALERDASEKHRVAMGSLESARATLERKVEDLRAFEREYRTRLKSYLETQLRQLESQADDSLAPPRIPATASLPPAGASSMSGQPSFGGQSSFTSGGQPSFGGQSSFGGGNGQPSFGGQPNGAPTGAAQMAPAGMPQPMAAVRPQPPQPMQQAPAPMRGFLIDEDGDN